MTQVSFQKELLVVLPGLTAMLSQCRQGEAFLRQHSHFDVLYIRFGMRWGTARCASHVAQQLAPIQSNYPKIHFLNYIRGGMSFLAFIKEASLQNLRNVIFDRGSAAEQVAKKLSGIFGPLTRIVFGMGVEDVASWKPDQWRWSAPEESRTGVLIEQGTSRIAKFLGIGPKQIVLPQAFRFDESCEIPESHDDVYTSADFLRTCIHFFETGTFPSSSPEITG